MEDIVNIIEINKYMYFDKNCGVFCLTSEASEIIYRQKEIICSYSGADEWINFFTLEMMNLYTGSSPYNHAIGTCDHHEAFPRIKRIKRGYVIGLKSLLRKNGERECIR